MKKQLLTLILAGALLTSTGIVASAENTNISYTVGAVYTVTIPSDVTLRDTDYTDYIKAEGATAGSVPVLDEGKKIKVKLTGAKNGFNGTNLTVKQSDSAKATYTLIGKDNTPVAQCRQLKKIRLSKSVNFDLFLLLLLISKSIFVGTILE